MRAASRPNSGTRPSTIIISAAAINTAIAVGHEMPGVVAASNAAPGVDQASTMGRRVLSDSAMLPRPVPRQSTVIAEPV